MRLELILVVGPKVRLQDRDKSNCLLLELKQEEHASSDLLDKTRRLNLDMTLRTMLKAWWPKQECQCEREVRSPMRAEGGTLRWRRVDTTHVYSARAIELSLWLGPSQRNKWDEIQNKC